MELLNIINFIGIRTTVNCNHLRNNKYIYIYLYIQFFSQIQSNTTALDSLRLNDEHLMRTSPFNVKKEEEIDTELKEIDERHNSPDTMLNNNSCYRSDWGPESLGLWHSGPSSLSLGQTLSKSIVHQVR